MKNSKKIDYSKFKVEVFTPDGVLIREAAFNSSHEFFCPGLTPGQNYNILFTYNGAFLMCSSFTCNVSGRVVLLSPAHLLFNGSLRLPNPKFVGSVKTAIKTRKIMNVPLSRWEKRLLRLVSFSDPIVNRPCLNSDGFNLYVSGLDISNNNR